MDLTEQFHVPMARILIDIELFSILNWADPMLKLSFFARSLGGFQWTSFGTKRVIKRRISQSEFATENQNLEFPNLKAKPT